MKDVIISGAGPVGMTAALILAREGKDVTVLETGPGLATQSRASTWHPPTLELLKTVGIADTLVEQGLVVTKYQYRSREKGLIAEMDMGLLEEDTNFPFRLQLEQSVYTSALLEELQKIGVDVRFNSPVERVENGESSATAYTESGEAFEGRIVIGADGASSPTRKSLGIQFGGMTYEEKFLTITSTFPFDKALPDFAPVSYVADANEWMVLLQVPRGWRVLVPTEVDLEMGTAETEELLSRKMNAVAEGAGNRSEYEWTVYRVHQRVADHMAVGRVALIGDAGHVNSPIGGMGMNSGIHDAFEVSMGILDTLESGDLSHMQDACEARRRFAIDYVQAATVANTKGITMKEGAEERQNRLKAISQDRDRMYEYVLHSSMIQGGRPLVENVKARFAHV